jgi:UDP-N-acetylmuramate--alanine ligase
VSRQAGAAYRPPPGSIPTLEVPTLHGIKELHMVGIGGAGMSGIARLLLSRGIAVTGSDLKSSRSLDELRGLGARISVPHDEDNLGPVDAVVVSSAIPAANPELVAARRRGIPILARAQVLAALAAGYRTVAIAGTHGKTTTTSMLAVVLEVVGEDPTYVIGGHLNESGSGAHHGDGGAFVAEADESDGSFLLLRPEIAVVTNVEADHLDFYADGLRQIEAAFAAFMRGASQLIVCGDDRGAAAAVERAGVGAQTYGIGEGNDVRLTPGGGSGAGGSAGSVRLEDGSSVPLRLRVPGSHNLLNAVAAVLAARRLGVPAAIAARALETFAGVHRRFEHRGTIVGATFIDDYAHHPTELRATLATAGGLRRGGRLIAVFQPHRHSRTRDLWRELGESLAVADVVVVTDVYGAGEDPIPGVSGRLVAAAVEAAASGTRVTYLPHRSEIASFVAREIRGGDIVLSLGAGDITTLADEVRDRTAALEG